MFFLHLFLIPCLFFLYEAAHDFGIPILEVLHIAAGFGVHEVIPDLIAMGARDDAPDLNFRQTTLYWSIFEAPQERLVTTVRKLLDGNNYRAHLISRCLCKAIAHGSGVNKERHKVNHKSIKFEKKIDIKFQAFVIK